MIFRSLVRELRHGDLSGFGKSDIPSPSAGWSTWAGVPVGEQQALRVLTVWSCVALISDAISTMPAGAFRDVDGFPKRASEPQLLAQPHAELDWTEWFARLLVSILLRGNAYGRVIERDGMGFPAQIEPLHPDWVQPQRDRVTNKIVYRVSREAVLIPAFDIFHVRGLALPGAHNLEGLDPINYARQTIGASLGAEEFGARFFGDGAQPSGVLQTDVEIDEPTAKRYQKDWLEGHGDRQRRPAVLGGGLKWTPISLKPDEAQFLATIKAKRGDIAGWFRVPPHMVGDVERSTSWGTGIEEQMLGFVTFTLGPWIIRFERALSAILPKPQYVKLNVAGLLRGRLLDRYRSYLMGRQGGWLNVDEIRALEEMAPVPGGEGKSYAQPMNWGPLSGTDPTSGEPPQPSEEEGA
ncbi:MAG: phage portal protein [Actinomycetota bacterium]